MGEAFSSDREGRGVYRVLVENTEETKCWGDPGVDGKIMLVRI
jgi:hypothetical protein